MDELLESLNLQEVMLGVGLFFLALIIFLLLLKRLFRRREKFPYLPQPVLTPAERKFHATLSRAVPKGALLLAKVRVADFLCVDCDEHDGEFFRYFGRIAQKHADFLLVDAKSSEPLLVVELDDESHRTNARTQESDLFKDRAFAAAGLPILRVPTQHRYDRAILARSIAIHIEDARM